MYNVSNALKNALDLSLREPSTIYISFGITNPDAPAASTIIDNGTLPYADTESIDLGVTSPLTYQTLELHRFLLDGVNPLPVKENPIYQGYVSEAMSNENREFVEIIPTIDISFNTYFEFATLSFRFDVSKNEYPTEMKIIVYHDDDIVLNQVSFPDSTEWVFEPHIPICNRIVIQFMKTNYPYRRVRITELIYGIQSVLDSEEIISCDFSDYVSPDSTSLSNMSFNFTLRDSEHRYDPENPQGVWEYLESRQPVNVVLGHYLDETKIERMQLCNVYSTGDFSVSGQEALTEVTIECSGILGHMTNTYYKGVYSSAGESLYNLGVAVVSDIGFEDVVQFDDSLKNITTHLPLPVMQTNQLLQLIANAGKCVIRHTRGGGLIIAPLSSTATGFTLDFDKMYSAPESSKIPPLRNLTSTYQNITIESELSEVASVTINVAEATTFTLTHQITINHDIITESGVTLVGTPEYYAYQTVIVASGSGKITVKGNKVNTDEVSITKHYLDAGEDLDSVTNSLIDSRETLEGYMGWIASVTQRRTTYSVDHRGYPYLDTTDRIAVNSNFKTDVNVDIIKNELSFNGAINGKSTLLTLEKDV